MSNPVVTVAIPVYKRLHYLEGALRSVAAQDYDRVELVVSDNGVNGPELEESVCRHYPKPFRFRSNDQSVGIVEHYNQLVEAAAGEYFVMLADDDELGPGYLSKLARVLDAEPDVAVGLGRLQAIDEAGSERSTRNVSEHPPGRMSDMEFIRIWTRNAYNFVCFTTFMARTSEIRAAGGFPPMPKGTSVDNGLVVKLCLGKKVAFVPDAVFRYRVYEESHGLALPYRELAGDLRSFLDWVDSDPDLGEFAAERPRDWAELRGELIRKSWGTYRSRWRTLYRDRLSTAEWVRAAFAMPFIPAYYRAVLGHLVRFWLSRAKQTVISILPVGNGAGRN